MTMDEEEEFMPDIRDLLKGAYALPVPEQVPVDVIQHAMDEAAELSGLPPCDLPRVEVLPRWMMEEALGRVGVCGAYHWEGHEIIVEGPWKADNPHNFVTLVHELTHAMQARVLGKDFLLRRGASEAVERQAYAVEAAWFRKHGVPNPRFADDYGIGRLNLQWQTGIPWETNEDVERAISYATVLPHV